MTPHPPPLWPQLKTEAQQALRHDPALAFMKSWILDRADFADALGFMLACKLASAEMPREALRDIFAALHADHPDLAQHAQRDALAVLERDPAATKAAQVFLYMKGFHALQTYRLAHALWSAGRRDMAWHLQSRAAEVFAVDIHPAAIIGHGVMMDHATDIVIGETCVIGNDVSMLHGVTLGGAGNTTGDRHPKIGSHVFLGAGCAVLGNVSVGDHVRIAVGSVVRKDIPGGATVVGNPARIITPSDRHTR